MIEDFDINDFPTLVQEVQKKYPNISPKEIKEQIIAILEHLQSLDNHKKWKELQDTLSNEKTKRMQKIMQLKIMIWAILAKMLSEENKKDCKKVLNDWRDDSLVKRFNNLPDCEPNNNNNNNKLKK